MGMRARARKLTFLSMPKRLIAFLLGWCIVLAAGAAEPVDQRAVIAQLAHTLGVAPGDISTAPIPGLYQVRLGPQIVYVSADGRYLVRGDLLDLKSGANLSRLARDQARLEALAQFSPDDMIVFAPPHARRSITVLTDIDCQFCRALERDRPALNKHGITVRYLLFPRTGVGSASWNKAVAVWCAKDRKAAFAAAMRGAVIPAGHCKAAAVAAGYTFAQQLGVDGTPIIITDRGRLIDGYLPLAALESVLKLGDAPPES